MLGFFVNLTRPPGLPPCVTQTAEIEQLRATLMQLANEEFPAAAKTGRYPVRFNHCFLRIVYDNLLGAQWQTVLPKGQPAYKQLSPKQLERAIAIGEEVIADPQTCRILNEKSLKWRGKL